MKDTKNITIGILAHVDAGKTTLSEAMLYIAGELKEPGRVDHGNSFLDDDPIERERGITIFSRQARFDFDVDPGPGEHVSVTLIDTPGHVDFSAEMERSLWVLDYALLVISGSEGVQAHTKTLVRMLKERGIPVFVFVNKMDIAIKKREELTSSLADELEIPAVDFTDACHQTEEFIDNVTLASPSLAEAVLENMSGGSGRDGMAEKDVIGDGDETEDDQLISDDQITDAVAAGEIVPVMFGSALRIQGVAELMQNIGRYTKEPPHKENFGAKVYKTMTGKDGEKLCFIKITGGSLRVRDSVKIRDGIRINNSVSDRGLKVRPSGNDAGKIDPERADKEKEREEKVSQIRLYSGEKFRQTDAAEAGTVCAVTGLGSISPGTALGDEEPAPACSSEPFMAYSLILPEGMDPHTAMDDMQTLTAEDPALDASWSEGGDEILIRIMGEVQLEILKRVIKERFGYEVGFGHGRVLYNETITDTYEGVGHFEPLRHYAEVHLVIEPGERGSGITITSDVSEDELALNWQRLIWTHLEEKAHTGVLTGSHLTDLKISIAAGRAHLKHTMGGDFREATYRAVRNAMMQARRDGNVLLLEPWCEYEIELPAGDLGRAAMDIKQMGGTQSSLEQKGAAAVIKGKAPSAKIAPYRQILTGYTSGEGKLTVTQCGYDAACDAEKIIEEIGYDPERDTANPADSVFVSHTESDIVKWDEVPEHMHLPGVLKKRGQGGPDAVQKNDDGSAYISGTAWNSDRGAGSPDARETERRRQAAEKDLQRIFEMTYGPVRTKVYKESREIVAGDDEISAENAARNEEIRAKHERKPFEKDEREPLLLIDGYNLIFADEALKELSSRDVGSARDSLIERLVNYAGYTGFEVKIVFDAYKVVPGEGSREDHDGVEVIYTVADELADVRIGRMAKEAKNRQVYVVSSDRLVQQDIWTKGAMRISSREFVNTLKNTEEEIRSRLSDV